ncbi:hypothetical protein [Mesorhizobium sp.]|uniref:hypothetical protein n=1 Tax=Mesorhizobium sp. TaxID=1871066 RepID=UPI0025BA9859|nr:hypothetical protein [Mesorhizobium sp.]
MATDIFKKTVADAKAKGDEIEVLARILAEKMQALHGDCYRIQIDHQHGFVLVVAMR